MLTIEQLNHETQMTRRMCDLLLPLVAESDRGGVAFSVAADRR
jgi:hypothetical protein